MSSQDAKQVAASAVQVIFNDKDTVSLEGHDLLRISGGQIVEHWTKMDSAELLQQLHQT